MVNELKPADMKLLAYLYHNAREPITKIAKALNLTREQAAYKIDKYQKEGIIKGFIPIINYSKLGYNNFVILMIKFNSLSSIEQFKKNLLNNPYEIAHGEMLAEYDLFITLIFKNEKERNEYLFDLLQKNHSIIKKHLLLEPYNAILYPLRFLENAKEKHILINPDESLILLDKKDREILKILNKDSNTKLVEIAQKTNLSPELVLYKLNKLKKEKVFLGSRALFDMQKLGFFYTILFINLNNFSKSNQEKLIKFAKSSKHIESLAFMIQEPNCYMQVFYKDESELRETMLELKSLLNEESFDIRIIPLVNEGEDYNALPFI